MTPMERVVTTLSFKEPDRVPLVLQVTMHGAREIDLCLEDYFSRAEHVVEGQLRLLQKFGGDTVTNFFYAGVEIEAFGGEVLFYPDGPPNSGAPFIQSREQILTLEPPKLAGCPAIEKVLAATRRLKRALGDRVPIVGVVMSPFSLPAMQMGMGPYIDLMYSDKDRTIFDRLMKVNQAHCVAYANAQLEAGATAIVYFDPFASPSMTPTEFYEQTGFEVAKATLSRIKGPSITHLASGRTLGVLEHLAQTGTAVIGTSALDDLAEVKAAAKGRFSILGNLNALEMRKWTEGRVDLEVARAIDKAARGGGFLLSDNHGEIPIQVPEKTLLTLSEAVRRHGRYPISRVGT